MAPVRKHSQGAPLLPVLAADARFEESLFRNRCGGQRPNPLIEQAVEEAAMPGQPIRTRARFRFPPAIHPRELPAATGVTAIILRQALRITTYSLNPLSGRMSRPAMKKHFALVQKLWRIGLPCGRLRKSAQESRHDKCVAAFFQ
jgi:hypothetical protein